MATVTNTYARAFADVVFSQHLDPDGILREAQSLVALVAESKDLRQVWETPSILAAQKPDGHWVYELEADATIPAAVGRNPFGVGAVWCGPASPG